MKLHLQTLSRIVVWALFLCLSARPGQAPSKESDELFARGVRLQKAGDLAGACGAYEAALKLSPRRLDTLSNLGLAYGALRQYDRAIGSFEKALAIDPKQPAVLFNLGLTYLQAGQYENARRTLSLAAGAEGNYLPRHYLGVSLLKLGRTEEGIRELEGIVGAHPGDLEAVYTLASAYLAGKQLEKAREMIDKVVSRRDTAEAHLITGSYWIAVRNYREAVAELRRAQQLNPVLPELGPTLGGAYAMTGSQETAARLFEEHVRMNPADFESLALLGWLYLESDRTEEAEKYLTQARDIRPKDVEVQFQLARIARAKGRFEEAAGLLERVVSAKPDHARAHVLLAQTYFRMKRTAEGKREQDAARRLNAEEDARRQKEAGQATGAVRP